MPYLEDRFDNQKCFVECGSDAARSALSLFILNYVPFHIIHAVLSEVTPDDRPTSEDVLKENRISKITKQVLQICLEYISWNSKADYNFDLEVGSQMYVALALLEVSPKHAAAELADVYRKYGPTRMLRVFRYLYA